MLSAASISRDSHELGWQPAACFERAHYEALARAALDKAAFEAEEAAGRAMSLEQAIDYARRLPLKAHSSPALKSEPDGLTEREREVAALVAQGRTNGEIAADLVLSKRTVEKHIASLFAKLSLTHRAQLVRWAVDQGLVVSPP